jgi:uncharacterized oligopeptide transporter (OPT) family protein
MRAMAELNARSIALGVAIGGAVGVGNVYLGLKVGFWEPGAILATILGFTFLSLRGAASARETNVIQALATAVATVPSVMGLFGAIPALEQLGRPVGPAALLAFALTLGLLGVLLAVVLRGAFVEREALPFPTGRAVATLIRSLSDQAKLARAQSRALLCAAVLAAAIVWLRDGRLHWIPPLVTPALVGAGALIGLRVGLSLLGGAALALAAARFGGLSEWLMWPGVALLIGGGLTALALEWRSFRHLGADLRGLARRGLAPWLAAAAVAGAGVVAVVHLGLGVPLLLAVVALLVAVPLISAFARSVGQTDIAHYAALGQATQGALAALPSSAAANVGGAAIAAGAAPQTVGLLYTFAVARELDAPRRPLVAAQLIGLVAGAGVALAAYRLLADAHGVGGAVLPVPFAASWKAMALVAEKGLGVLPAGALAATAVALAAGVLLTLLERTRLARGVPSPAGLGVGFLVPFGLAVALAAGAVAAAVLAARAPGAASRFLLAAASGLIVGESLAAVVLALLAGAV